MARDRDRTGTGHAPGGLAALLALLATACAPAPASGGADTGGPTIVSLNPCLDAILVEVAPEQVMALSHYSRDPGSSSIPPEVAAHYEVTGGTAEEVIALAPDLVLASVFLPQPTRAALERAGLRVATFGSPTSIAESAAQVREVAALAGRESEGERLVRDMEQAAQPPAEALPVSTLLWQPGEIVPGEATLVAQMLRARGFINHGEAMGLSQADFAPLETVLADPPELLLVAGDSAGQRHPLLGRLTHTRVETFDPRLLFCGGRTIVGLAMRLDRIRAELGK
ncbi:MAG: ABC transporter substrate-binding protein [Erythrobacter sp.]|jgi:iron complex transport system substrate-binding protein|nr:ABC transporter substrate-binding protein [Erythrobacter sp.]